MDKRILKRNEVHIWMIDLDQEHQQVDRLAKCLSEAEGRRASRFHFERHRRRYIVSQGGMRHILGTYLDTEPGRLHFEQGDHGKPYLSGPLADSGIQFNLTHSHEIAILALTQRMEIGVDVEYIREKEDADSLAARYFSPEEQKAYFSLPGDQRNQAFYNCWTRKEAFIKAIGEGLSYPLDRFDVNLVPGQPARLLKIENDPVEASHWTLEAFQPDEGYAAAVALRMNGAEFKHFWYAW